MKIIHKYKILIITGLAMLVLVLGYYYLKNYGDKDTEMAKLEDVQVNDTNIVEETVTETKYKGDENLGISTKEVKTLIDKNNLSTKEMLEQAVYIANEENVKELDKLLENLFITKRELTTLIENVDSEYGKITTQQYLDINEMIVELENTKVVLKKYISSVNDDSSRKISEIIDEINTSQASLEQLKNIQLKDKSEIIKLLEESSLRLTDDLTSAKEGLKGLINENKTSIENVKIDFFNMKSESDTKIEEINTAIADIELRINNVEQDFIIAIDELNGTFDKKISELETDYLDKGNMLESDYLEKKEALELDYNNLKVVLEGDYNALKEELNRQMNEYRTEINTFKSNMENDMKVKYDKVNTRLDEVFQSVSKGKGLVASAITDKGVSTDANASFSDMAANILLIDAGSAPSVTPNYEVVEYRHHHEGSSDVCGGCYTTEIKHVHEGSANSGGGCYTVGNICGGTYQTQTYTKTCWNSVSPVGPFGPDSSGQMYWAYGCSVCGNQLGNSYTGGNKTCGKILSTSTYTQCDKCGTKGGSGTCNRITSYSLGCGKTLETTDSYKLSCGYDENELTGYDVRFDIN